MDDALLRCPEIEVDEARRMVLNRPRERDDHCHGGGVSASPRGPSPGGRGAGSACGLPRLSSPLSLRERGRGGGILAPPWHWSSSRGHRSSPSSTPALNSNFRTHLPRIARAFLPRVLVWPREAAFHG